MKKALTTLSLLTGSVVTTLAQTATINIGQTASQGQVNGGAILQLLNLAQNIVNRLVPFAIGIAVLVFFWYLIRFITKGGESSDAKAASVKGMGLSVLALFLMVSIWGIIGFMGSIFGVGQGGSIPTPCIPVPGGTSC